MWQITEQNGAKPGGFLCREKRNASERLVHIMLTGAYAPKKEVFMCFSDKCRPDRIEADIIIEKIVYDRSGPTGPTGATAPSIYAQQGKCRNHAAFSTLKTIKQPL